MTYSAFSWYRFKVEPENIEVNKILTDLFSSETDLVMIGDVDEKLLELSTIYPETTIKVYASGEEPFDFSAKTFIAGKLIFFSNLDSLFPDLNDNNITKFD